MCQGLPTLTSYPTVSLQIICVSIFFFFLAPSAYFNGGPVSPLIRFYCGVFVATVHPPELSTIQVQTTWATVFLSSLFLFMEAVAYTGQIVLDDSRVSHHNK